jgi:GNAT superfamily N-acetyltransferase
MILLHNNKYEKVTKPLSEVTFNNLFARSVIEKKVIGSIYVDNTENPRTFYINHPYGMSLLFGETDNNDFNSWLIDYALNTYKVRDKYEWLQAFPDSWNKKISELFGNNLIKSSDNIDNKKNYKIEENIRVNFKFNKEKYLDFKSKNNNNVCNIIRTDKVMYENMQGSVVPKYFWKDAEHFFSCGIGYSVVFENNVISTAYSAFIHDSQLELGIETIEGFRGKGFAMQVCSALINYCINNGYEPIWACRLENVSSYKLAQKLGFEPTAYIPFYRLNN